VIARKRVGLHDRLSEPVGDFASFVSAGEKPFSGNGNRDGRRLGLNVGLVDSKGEAFEAVHAVETIRLASRWDG
jgi:hypothetical protein